MLQGHILAGGTMVCVILSPICRAVVAFVRLTVRELPDGAVRPTPQLEAAILELPSDS